jgi:hypothetical protein
MSNEQHLEVVSKILAECAEIRAKRMGDWVKLDAEEWRLLLLRVALHGSGMHRDSIERDYADRFVGVWERYWYEGWPEGMKLDLSGANLSDNIFACPRYVNVQWRRLVGANFRNAKLDNTEWLCSHLDDADFTGARLRNSFMLQMVCKKTIFREADLTGATLALLKSNEHGMTLHKKEYAPDFSGANLSGAKIILDDPLEPILKGANLNGCHLTHSRHTKFSDKEIDDILLTLNDEQREKLIVERPESKLCFIATAACGTDKSDEVLSLQAFRDTILRQRRVGQMLITMYESASPPFASFIAQSAFLRNLVRTLIVCPAAHVSTWALRRNQRSLMHREDRESYN